MKSAMNQRGKYRIRTSLRGSLPGWLGWTAPKGAKDCGSHDWYRQDEDTWRCYHCEVGVTNENPWSEFEQIDNTVGALRLAIEELPETEDTLETIARLLAELDGAIHPIAEQVKVEPALAVRQLGSVKV